MSKIIIQGTQCFIKDEVDIDFVRELDNMLSFKIQGAEFMPAYRGHVQNGKFTRWDGIQRILTNSLSFPFGLLRRVEQLYKDKGKSVEIVNERPTISPIQSTSVLDKLASINKNPYPYQLETLEAVKKYDNGIIRIATGGGKTLIITLMLAHFGKAATVYVIGTDLLYQMHKLLEMVLDTKVGIIGDGNCEICDINVASVWTVGQALGLKGSNILLLDGSDKEKKLEKTKYKSIVDSMRRSKVHIFDECHLAACETIQTIYKNIRPEHIYGLSASPWRDDGKDLLIEAVFGSKIVDISASELILNGYLVRPTIKFITVPSYPGNKSDPYPTVYADYVSNGPARNALVLKGAIKLVEQGYQPLVSYMRLNHGVQLYNEISKHMPCILLSGNDSAKVRDEAKEKLEKREINCILASSIFDIGVDLPSLSGLIVASGGKSSIRALQRIGRTIRTYPNKQRVAIIDFVDNAPFLLNHSVARRDIYSMESEFDVIWPKQ